MFSSITNFNNIANYLPIINGCLATDLIMIFLLYNKIYNSKYLKLWYETYRLSAFMADVLILHRPKR